MPYLLLLLLLAPQGDPVVEGLNPGESATWLPSLAEGERAPDTRGRVLDGSTYEPVAGALLENMSEGYGAPSQVFGSALSDRDGEFELIHGPWGLLSVRVRAAGYHADTLPRFDLWRPDQDLLLFPIGATSRLQLLDLDGNPIAGGRLATHQSCSHDPPALEATSDDNGWIDWSSAPAFCRSVEFWVSAPGHGALASFGAEDLVPAAGFSNTNRVFLPRRLPARLLLLNAVGEPLAKRHFTKRASPEWWTAWSDESGVLTVDSLYGERRFPLSILNLELDSWDYQWFAYVTVPAAHAQLPLPVRLRGDDYPGRFGEDDATARLQVAWRLSEGEPAVTLADATSLKNLPFPLHVYHESGWVDSGGDCFDLPPGRVHVVVGAPFSGWMESQLSVELNAAEEQTVVVEPQRETELKLLLPPGGAWQIHLQTSEDGFRAGGTEQEELTLTAPRGEPVTVLAHCDDGDRRGRWNPRDGQPAVIDLRPGSSLVRRDLRAAWQAGVVSPARLELELTDEGGRALALPSPDFDLGPFGDLLEPSGDPASIWSFELPPDMDWQLLVKADGYLPRWTQGHSPAAGERQRISLALLRPARVLIEDATQVFEFDDLVPGRRRFFPTLADGRRGVLDLDLEEGEQRWLRIAIARG